VLVLSEDVEDESNYESEPEEHVIEVPVIYEGSAFYVCSECGCNLTEIPYYNRYYCENCGLHY
jgi:allophanate hydrolase subunit 1